MPASSLGIIRTIDLPFSRNPNFCGREELLEKIQQILQPSHKRRICVLHGIGGIGKTQTAIEYAYSYRGPGKSIFWVNAKDMTTVRSSGRSILQALVRQYTKTLPSPTDFKKISCELGLLGGIDELTGKIKPEFFQSAWETVKTWLGQEENQDWLLIVDNNDDLQSVDLQLQIIPSGDWGHVIVTTRRSELATIGDSILVEDLESSDGLKLLLDGAKTDPNHVWLPDG